MAIFDQKPAPKKDTAPFTSDLPPFQAPPAPADNFGAASSTSAPRAHSGSSLESLIAADLTIEGKIEGAGDIRIAGKFKGDVNVKGDLTIEPGAKVTGGVRAKRVVIAGEVEGNIEAAAVVELQQGGVLVGDVKAGTMTVAAGARMRGQADFGWDEKGSKPESFSAS